MKNKIDISELVAYHTSTPPRSILNSGTGENGLHTRLEVVTDVNSLQSHFEVTSFKDSKPYIARRHSALETAVNDFNTR